MQHRSQRTPSYWTVLVGAGVTGALVSALIVGGSFIFMAYVYHYKGPRTPNSVLSKFPIPVSAPLVRPNDSTPQETAPHKPTTSTTYMPMRPVSFAPLVRRVIPSVVNISTDDPEPAPVPVETQKDAKSHGTTTVGKTPSASSMSVICPPNAGKNSKACAKDPQTGKPALPSKKDTDKAKKDSKSSNKSSNDNSSSEDEDDSSSMGSGFIVDPSGIIVTNAHVVNSTGVIHVSLSDGRVLTAKLLGTDPLTDIAVLRVRAKAPLPYVHWGRSRLMQIGDWVIAAGNPFGFGSSITSGIVSAVGRDLGLGDLDDFMQFDAPINPGNSGGPTFNMKGEVVAMNAAIATPNEGSVGIGFGIPSDLVAPIVKQIRETGIAMHGWLGITLNDETLPVQIVKVDPDSAGWKAGLRPKDKILQIDGAPVQSARAILRSIGLSSPGTVFAFTINQDGKEKTLPIKLAARPDTAVRDSDTVQDQDTTDGDENSSSTVETTVQDVPEESET